MYLVNLTNPMMMNGPFRELIAGGEHRLVVKLPAGATAAKQSRKNNLSKFRLPSERLVRIVSLVVHFTINMAGVIAVPHTGCVS